MTPGAVDPVRAERDAARALELAAAALSARDLSRARLSERLRRRGVDPAVAAKTLDALGGAGLLDDARLAARRAEALAERGLGDAAIEARLERDGLGSESVDAALAGLRPEDERARRLAVREAGRGAAGLARLLARRGFSEDAVDAALAACGDTAEGAQDEVKRGRLSSDPLG